MPSHKSGRCSYCRRLSHARRRGATAEVALMERYARIDHGLAMGLGVQWPRKLLQEDARVYA
jgi:hypothetical protein